MAHGGDMMGTPVSKEEAAIGLGFNTPEEMDRFYKLMEVVNPLVTKNLENWFGGLSTNYNQISFAIASDCVEAFMKVEKNA